MKQRFIDPVSVGIIAITFLVTVFLLVQEGVLGGGDPKIAILETGMLLDEVHVDRGGEELRRIKEQIELQSEKLASEGYIVLRSEIVRSAPSEFYYSLE